MQHFALFLGSISAEQQVTLFGLVGQEMQKALKSDPISLNMRDTKCKKMPRDHSDHSVVWILATAQWNSSRTHNENI